MQDKIRAFGDKECGQGATLDEIDHAQSELGGVFPESYRSFLLDYGWARFAHEEIYGLGKDVPNHLNLIRNAISERRQMSPLIPEWLIPIMNDGAGNHYCLDASISQESPVVFWDHELGEDQKPETVSANFAQWLVDLLDRLSTPQANQKGVSFCTPIAQRLPSDFRNRL